jgi:YVTN family beta-propeller protein
VSYSLGVDLGTTFVAAAVANASRVEMFTLGDRSVVTPAVVYLREDGTVVTGDAAGRRAVSNPDRVGREFKRRLGDPTPVMLGGAPHAVTALLASLLSDVVARVSATQGAAPDSMVLTHPANWGPFRRELFDEVPQLAGVAMPRMVTEPEAAAAHYAASRRLENGEIVAVYDLGGGTFDATVLRKRPEGIEILGSPEGIERLGGVDFDEAILAHVNYAAGGALSELDMSDPQTTVALARLRQDCVLAKEALSIDTETTIPVFLPNRHFDVRLTRAEFEDMIRAPIESTIGALNRTLRSAEVTPEQLSAVLLVGGSSRIPLVARMVSEELGRPTVVDAHPKYAVALGAATLAGGQDGADGSRASDGSRGSDGPAPATTAFPPVAVGAAGAAAAAGAFGAAAPAPASAPASAPEPVPAPFSLPTGSGLPSFGPSTSAPSGPPPAAAALSAPAVGAPPPAPPVPTQPVAPPQPTGPQPYGGGPGGPSGPGGPGGGGGGPGGGGGGFGGGTPGGGAPPPGPSEPSGGGGGGRRALIVGLVVVLLLAAVGGVGWFAANQFGLLGGSSGTTTSVAGGRGSNEELPPAADGTQPEIATSVPIPSLGATVPVGRTPGFIALSPNGRLAYIANRNAGVVTVVDTSVDKVVATIPVQAGPPQYLAFAPDGKRVYVSIFNDQKTINVVGVLDTTSNSITSTIPVGTRPFALAVTPDGSKLYVPNHDSGTVSVIDTASSTLVHDIKVAPNPHWVAFSPDGSTAYTANHESGVVSIINTSDDSVAGEVRVQVSPHSLEVSPDDKWVANVNYDSDSATVIDTKTQQVVATVPVGHKPQDIAWAPDGRFLYVTGVEGDNLTVINAQNWGVTATLPTGDAPTSLAVTPDGKKAYVTNLNSGTLTEVNLTG